MSATRVVVTGLGTTSPVGGDVPTTWAALLAGQSGVRPLTEAWAEQLPVKIAARVAGRAHRGARAGQGPPPRPDRAARAGRGDGGLGGRGLDQGGVDPERLGVAMATGIGGVQTLLDQHTILEEKGPRRVSPLSVPMLMPNASAANISLYVGARAAVNTPVSACASGNEGIALARRPDPARPRRRGARRRDEAAIHPLPMAAFAQMMALSEATTATRPRSPGRGTSTVTGSCSARARRAGLESEEHAQARGAKIYAEVLGAGITADAHDIAQPDPSGEGGARAMVIGAARGRHRAGRHRAHQRARHLDAGRATSRRA